MKKEEENIRSIDPDDYPSIPRVIFSFLLFPLGFIFMFLAPKDHFFTRKVYLYTALLSLFLVGLILIRIIV